MSLPRRFLSVAVAAACLVPALVAGEAGPRQRTVAAADSASARVIVKYREDSALMRWQAARAGLPRHADTMGRRLGFVLTDGHVLGARTQSLRARGIDADTLARRLAAQPDVEWAVPAQRRYATAAPNDPYYGPNQTTITPAVGQWYLRAPDSTAVASINAVGAWDVTTGSSAVTVAVLDTGITAHPDLAGKSHPGYDFVSSTPNTQGDSDTDPSDTGDWNNTSECQVTPSSWHGTQTAGLIGAATNNGIGIAGVGRDVMLLPVRVLGRCGGFDDDIIAGMLWAGGLDTTRPNPHPAKVINMSLGSTGACIAPYPETIAALAAASVTVVASAGNEGGAVGVPANCPGALSVAGVRHVGTKVGYSNAGVENLIAAPAGNCVNNGTPCLYPIMSTSNAGSTTPGGSTYSDSFKYAVGTSFSAPQVAGVIGLMLSADPTLTPARIRQVLKATARPFPTRDTVAACSAATAADECYCTTATCGAGMLDAAAAVAAVAPGGRVPPTIVIAANTTTPAPGAAVTLDARGSTADGGRTVTGWAWSVTGGAALASLNGATDASTALLNITGGGDITVQLVVTDSAGSRATSSVTLYAQAAPPGESGGGGGGALSTFWVTLLALAVAVLLRQRWRSPN